MSPPYPSYRGVEPLHAPDKVSEPIGRPRAGLVLGGVQLGSSYGIMVPQPQPSRQEALDLLQEAESLGFGGIDTARAYGESESVIGRYLGQPGAMPCEHIVTKLAPLEHLTPSGSRRQVEAAVDRSLDESLDALGLDALPTLLLHRMSHMTSHGGAIWARLLHWSEAGRIGRLGVSVESPGDLLEALKRPEVRHVQLPLNILDGRWFRPGIEAALQNREGVCIDVRSAYLQGVLLQTDPRFWPAVPGYDPSAVIRWLDRCRRLSGREHLADLCLGFVQGVVWVNRVVLGCATVAQLKANAAGFDLGPLSANLMKEIAGSRPTIPESLLMPSRWNKVRRPSA